MKTPAGLECKFFYGNYFRGRKQEECRLLKDAGIGSKWTPNLCRTCPVPDIMRANVCPNMVLHPKVTGGFLKWGQRVRITAYCTLSQSTVTEPQVGCGQCHPIPDVFKQG